LLARKQKSFTTAADGGHAMLLISRGIVVRALAPGQVFYESDMPMMIPDHIWRVLEAHIDQFPYTPPDDGEPDPDCGGCIGWSDREARPIRSLYGHRSRLAKHESKGRRHC
jgi:hypothetical protein